MNKKSKWIVSVGLVLFASSVYAITILNNYSQFNNTQIAPSQSNPTGNVGQLYVGVGTPTLLTAGIDNDNPTRAGGSFMSALSTDSETSPTHATSIVNKSYIAITTNVAQTGWTLTGGLAGQRITLAGTSDSNTVRFDDGASYIMAGNCTLGVGDTITFICTNASTPVYTELCRSNN